MKFAELFQAVRTGSIERRHTRRFAFFALATVFLVTAVPSPTNASMIVDVNSRVNDFSNPVQVFLQAGTYAVDPIGTADGGAFTAWNAWGSTTCSDPSGCAVPPTTSTGWLNRYNVISPDITAVSVDGTVLSPLTADPRAPAGNVFVDTATETWYRAFDLKTYPTDILALTNAQASVFTLGASGSVGFAISDSWYIDNIGGMSLRITAVPIPAAIWLFGSGLGLLGFVARRKTNV